MLTTLILSSFLTCVELNCENLFDTVHDSLKNDIEFTPDGSHRWTRTRYWRKVNHIAQEIIALGENGQDTHQWSLPSIVVLCEVENDSVMVDLTRKSLLRSARYEYLITHSPDQRGINVAMLYDPFLFSPIRSYSLRVPLRENMRPTRDILYVCGRTVDGDTLHVFGVHAPSRTGGERASRPNRMQVERRLAASVDSIYQLSPDARILITGDFNDYAGSPALDSLYTHQLVNISEHAVGANGARGTYRFRGEWGSLDQMICSPSLASRTDTCYIGDLSFLLEEDEKYGGVHPRRCYQGPKYLNGFSDHLPLVAIFRLKR